MLGVQESEEQERTPSQEGTPAGAVCPTPGSAAEGMVLKLGAFPISCLSELGSRAKALRAFSPRNKEVYFERQSEPGPGAVVCSACGHESTSPRPCCLDS